MGGVWERLVISCKKVLNILLQNHVLTDEVLLTAITEVESLVNSRPLTEVSSDADDLEALTPNHFLIGRATPNLPPGIFADKEISSQKRWRQAQVITIHIWKRWLHEYLPGLTARKKWFQAVPNLKVGDLVLIVDYVWNSKGMLASWQDCDRFPWISHCCKISWSEDKVWTIKTTYVGVFDWLVFYAVCDYPPTELSVDKPNTTELVTREIELVIVWNVALESAWTTEVFLALVLRSLCSAWSILHFHWANFVLSLLVSHLEVRGYEAGLFHAYWVISSCGL